MFLIDTHAHVYLEDFSEDLNEVQERMQFNGVKYALLPNIDLNSVDLLMGLSQQNPQTFIPMMGLHPCSVKSNFSNELNDILKLFEMNRFIAVGEIGMDLYWDKTTIEYQKSAFIQQLDFALLKNLSVVIHARDSYNEIFEILETYRSTELKGVFHCFSAGEDEIKFIDGLESFYFGIGGVLTFKNGGLDKVLHLIPKEKIILETDSPYLSPHPFRGKRNEPSYVKLVAEKMTEVLNMEFSDVCKMTSENANSLFKLTDWFNQ